MSPSAARVAARYLTAGSVNDYHRAIALAWTKLDQFPIRHRDGVEAIWLELFTPPVPESFFDLDKVFGPGASDKLLKAAQELQKGQMLPSKRGVRLNHSIMKGDSSQIIPNILRNGLRADPGGSGAHSESPGSLFFVADKFHSAEAPVLTVDIPESWEGWDGAINVDWYAGRMTRKPSPGATVALGYSVPAKYIVAVNGLPVADYKRGLKKQKPPQAAQ